ncbi:MAG: bestrophin family ion channel [Bacteroidota bacterium]
MYVKRYYSFWMTIRWSRRSLFFGLLYSAAIVVVYELTHLPFALPWQPISVIGIAVAFFLSFKNNVSYDRTWEARKIWGKIINDSRTFATAILTMPVQDAGSTWKKNTIHRHLAWLLALKHNMRNVKSWEHQGAIDMLVFTPNFIKECKAGMNAEIAPYLSPDELTQLKKYTNLPTQLLKNQSLEIERLFNNGQLSEYKHVWLHQLIGNLYDVQGMTERIKNFPLPRQYASTGLWILYIFCALIPFGLLDIFQQSKTLHYWLTIPFSTVTIWLYFLVDRIGDYSENPFEAAYNDVPISAISRAIEIDLREMLDETTIPAPYVAENGFLM